MVAFALGGGWLIDVMAKSPEVQSEARIYLIWMVLAPILGVWSWMFDGIFIGATQTRDMRNMMAISFVIYWLAVVAALNTVISLYYYLRIVKAMFLEKPTADIQIRVSFGSQALLFALLVPTLGLGIYWQPLAKVVSGMF